MPLDAVRREDAVAWLDRLLKIRIDRFSGTHSNWKRSYWTKDPELEKKMERFKAAMVVDFCRCGHQVRHHKPKCEHCGHCESYVFDRAVTKSQRHMLSAKLFGVEDPKRQPCGCDGSGLIYFEKELEAMDGSTFMGFVVEPCICPTGESKAAYLKDPTKSKRKRGKQWQDRY